MNLHVVLYHLERFVAWAQWDLNEVGPSSWVGRHENGEADIKIDIFQNFFTVFLVTIEQVSEAVLKTCRAWALRELNQQLLSGGNSKNKLSSWLTSHNFHRIPSKGGWVVWYKCGRVWQGHEGSQTTTSTAKFG